MRSIAIVVWVPIFILGWMASLTAAEENEPISLLSQNAKLQIQDGEKSVEAWAITPLAPLQFNVTGPGTLTVQFIKNTKPTDPNSGKVQSTFTILKNGVIWQSIVHTAPVKKERIYKDNKDLVPGKAMAWSVEVPEETWSIGILLSPDAMQGGAIGLNFEKPETEQELIPLVPLVPLVAPVPAVKEVVPEPVAEPAPKPVEEPKPAEEVKPAEEAKPVEETKPEEEAKPEDETKPVEEEKPAEEVAATEDKGGWPNQDGPHYVMLEPRLGVNLAMQSVDSGDGASFEANPGFSVGMGARYIMPFLDERFRIGLGLDWYEYSFSRTVAPDTADETTVDVTLTSVPIMLEFDAFILTKGIFQPFVGLGAGANWVKMDYASIPGSGNSGQRIDVESKDFTYAVAFWGGCLFNVWWGGPFVKVRYMISKHDYVSENITLLEAAEHGGLSFLLGYDFVF